MKIYFAFIWPKSIYEIMAKYFSMIFKTFVFLYHMQESHDNHTIMIYFLKLLGWCDEIKSFSCKLVMAKVLVWSKQSFQNAILGNRVSLPKSSHFSKSTFPYHALTVKGLFDAQLFHK
jgi:hypothetical protein